MHQGFQDVTTVTQKPEPVTDSIDQAISLILSAAELPDGLTEDQKQLLLTRGLITEDSVSLTSTLNNLLTMIDAIQRKVMYGKELLIQDPKDLSHYMNNMTKLMEMVRKSSSEARRVEELSALEACMLQMIEDLSSSVDRDDDNYDRIQQTFNSIRQDYERNLKQIASKFEA